ncbi:MAG: integrin alpha [Planctomycetes bacterium]|nr:integrin alpha [Planctomycetota bacterium]
MIRQRVLLACALLATVARAQSPLYTFNGAGSAVAAAGDVDLDGVPDLLVAAAGINGYVGHVELHSGSTGSLLLTLSGLSADDGFGRALASERDLDGDGRPDIVVGAPGPQSLPSVQAFSSGTGLVLWTQSGSFGSSFGNAVALGGDLDGDGVGDVLIGVPDGGLLTEGEVLAVSGASGATLRSHQGVGGPLGDFGFAVVFLGDVDGDSIADYAVGDTRLQLAVAGPGEVVLFSGATGGVLRTLTGAKAVDCFGASLANAGDVDGDGLDELVIGACGEFHSTFTTGSVLLFSAATGALLHKTQAMPAQVMFGASVAGVGDYDGDGVRDYAGHNVWQGVGGVLKSFGRARVLSGATGLDIGLTGLGYQGPIASVGDVDGDSIPDLLVGGAPAGAGQTSSALFLGRDHAPVVYCTAKTSSKGCVPISTATHGVGASIGQGITVSATAVPKKKNAILFWSVSSGQQPFAGGWMCVGAPKFAAKVLHTGGSAGDCSGSLAYTFTSAQAVAHSLQPGATVHTQFWIRDQGFAAPQNLALSAGVQFDYWP